MGALQRPAGQRHYGSLLLSTGRFEGRGGAGLPAVGGGAYRRGCGSGKWLIRSVGVRVRAGRAGYLRRPAVPSRTRVHAVDRSRSVGNELAIDGVGDPALEAAEGFE